MKKYMTILVIFVLFIPMIQSTATIQNIAVQSTANRSRARGTLNVKFDFNVPIVILNISNETGYTNNMKDFVVIRNLGDIRVQVKLGFSATPANPNITCTFSKNNIVLDPEQDDVVYINISIAPGTISGRYEVTIHGKASPHPPPETNPIYLTQEYRFTVIVGGKAYRLDVKLRQPDGTPVRGLVRVAYIYENTLSFVYQDIGSDLFFFVVQGEYLIEVYFGGTKREERRIYVANNTTVTIQFSLIKLEDIEVISQPRSKTDTLVFRFTLINDDPLTYERIIRVMANLISTENGSTILSNVEIAELTIRSTMVETLIGVLPPPIGNWTNDTYILQLIAIDVKGANKTTVMANVSSEIEVIVIEKLVRIEEKYIPVFPFILAALIAGLIGFLAAKGTTRAIKPVSRAPFKIKRLGIIARGSLIGFYDFSKKRAMIMSDIDRTFPSLIALIRSMESLRPTSWVLETPMPLAWNIGREKFLIYPIDPEFSLLVSTDPRVNERDMKVLKNLMHIASYIKRIHSEAKLTYDYIMKHQREYRYYVRRIAEYISSAGLSI